MATSPRRRPALRVVGDDTPVQSALDLGDLADPAPTASETGTDADPVPDDLDAAVPYRLTGPGRAVARAVVEPVDGEPPVLPDLEDDNDPRRARARALRRGGLGPSRIARLLGVDELAVRVWIGDARPVVEAREDVDHDSIPSIEPAERRFREARRAAAADIGGRLESVAFTRGLSLVAASATVDRHAVLVTTADRDVAGRAVAWLVEHAGARRGDVRAVVQLGDRRGGDLAARRWADDLGIDPGAVRVTSWTAPPHPTAVQVLVRVSDPGVAARVAGWRDALLGLEDPDDVIHRRAF